MNPASLMRVATLLLVCSLAAAGVAAQSAQSTQTVAVPPGLPGLGPEPRLPNPYRGDAVAIGVGAAAYEQHCATCHGESATRPVAEGPDLRRLNGFCNRLTEAPLRQHCLRDVDSYFLHSVREGKLRAGQMHMPAWKHVLPQELIWAIRSFTESRPLPPPRTLPDLPPGGALVPTAAERSGP